MRKFWRGLAAAFAATAVAAWAQTEVTFYYPIAVVGGVPLLCAVSAFTIVSW